MTAARDYAEKALEEAKAQLTKAQQAIASHEDVQQVAQPFIVPLIHALHLHIAIHCLRSLVPSYLSQELLEELDIVKNNFTGFFSSIQPGMNVDASHFGSGTAID